MYSSQSNLYWPCIQDSLTYAVSEKPARTTKSDYTFKNKNIKMKKVKNQGREKDY